MKKISYIFAVLAAVFTCQVALAGVGALIQIDNNSDETLYPRVFASSHMSNTGNWPSSIAPHTTSSNIYVEEKALIDVHTSGELRLNFHQEENASDINLKFVGVCWGLGPNQDCEVDITMGAARHPNTSFDFKWYAGVTPRYWPIGVIVYNGK